MKLYGNDEVRGTQVLLKAMDPRHYRIEKTKENEDAVVQSFGKLLSGALGKVNHLQNRSDHLTREMIVNPERVSIHSVMIAAQKAELALSMTKAITERVVRAYREITNLR